MAGGSKRQRFLAWRRSLDVLDLDRLLTETVSPIREICGFDVAITMTIDRPEGELRFETQIAGAPKTFTDELERFYSDGRPAGMFSLDEPQRSQRNELVDLGESGRLLDLPAPVHRRLGFSTRQYRTWCDSLVRVWPTWSRHGLLEHFQTRMLVCEGATLVGIVNVLHQEPPSSSQVAWLRRMLPVYLRRMATERRLRGAWRDRSVLDASLDALAWPAYIVTATGAVDLTNTSGASLLRDPMTRAALRSASRCGSPEARVTEIREVGTPVRWLVELPRVADAARFAVAAADLGLTRRQLDILRHLREGKSHRAIGVALGISQRTVEHHVSSILAHVDVDTVSQAVVAIVARAQR